MRINKLLVPLVFSMLFGSGMAVASAWKVTSFTDGFTDKTSHRISVSSGSSSSSFGLLCSEERVVLFVQTKKYLNSDVVPVRLRINKGAVYDGLWNTSVNGTTAISGLDLVEVYLPILASAHEVLVEVTDHRGVAHESWFLIAEKSEGFQKFTDLCGLDDASVLEKAERRKALLLKAERRKALLLKAIAEKSKLIRIAKAEAYARKKANTAFRLKHDELKRATEDKARAVADARIKRHSDLMRLASDERLRLKGEAVVASSVQYIMDEIRQRWVRPADARNGMVVELVIHLAPAGEVVNVEVSYRDPSAPDAFVASVVQAVKKVRRFDKLSQLNSELFETNFRRFTVRFKPEDLKL